MNKKTIVLVAAFLILAIGFCLWWKLVPADTQQVSPRDAWISLFKDATNLLDDTSYGLFTNKLKGVIERENKDVQGSILSILAPDDIEELEQKHLMTRYLNCRNAIQNAEAIYGIEAESSGQESTKAEIAELFQWKMFWHLLQQTSGGARTALLEDQRKWLAWTEEHASVIIAASGSDEGATGADWFQSTTLGEIQEDRLNELFSFDMSYTEIYRDLKFASVNYKGKAVQLRHGRLYSQIDGKKDVGRIINPVFCRSVVIDGNIYKFAILEPDYILDHGPNCTPFSWACVWRNGKNTANYQLPVAKEVRHLPLFSTEREQKSGIKEISTHKSLITIISAKEGKPVIIDLHVANSNSID